MIFSSIGSLLAAGKQKKLARRINPQQTEYTENPVISDLYNAGKILYQGRMAGASQAEQNISSQAANTISGFQRNAGDASMLLALGAGVQGQASGALTDLATREAMDKKERFGIYSDTTRLMAMERDKVFQDKLRRYYDDLNYKRALEGASMQNMSSFWQGLDDTAKAVGSAFVPGGVFNSGVNPVAQLIGGSGMNAPSYYGRVERDLWRNRGRRIG